MSGSAGGFGTGFPDAPFVDDSGNLMPVWRQFLIALYKRTGAQAGSSPANAASAADLSAETAAREAADTALSHSIATETAARIVADEQEAATRAAMDDFLVSTSSAAAGLATEQAARIAGDNSLQASKLAKAGDAMTGGTIDNVPIGGTTPAAGHFTTLAASGLISPRSTVGIAGTVAADNAQAGSVGEFVSASVASLSALPLTSAVALTVTSISLAPGDWDVEALVGFAPAATTSVTVMAGGISATAATLPLVGAGGLFRLNQPATVPGAVFSVYPTGAARMSLAATTTVYLVALATFTVSTIGGYGYIRARRVR